jgi:hypothetical protein
MFVSPDVPCGLASAALKIETIDDVDHRVAHVTCKVEPFTPELARELGDAVYAHLFTRDPERADVPMPRREITEVGFSLPLGLQMISAKSHPDLKVDHTLRRVKVTRVRVSRPDPDKPRLTLAFVLSVELGERTTMDWLVRAFGRVQYLTFGDEQPGMLDNQGVRDALRAFKDASTRHGMTTTITHDGRSVTLVPDAKPTACEHGVDITDTCPACEADAQAAVESVNAELAARAASRAVSPADIQAVAAQRGRAARSAKKRGRQ